MVEEKKFYTQWWFFVIIAIIFLGSIFILNSNQENKPNSEFPEELQYIETPKVICLTNEQIFLTEQMYNSQLNISKLYAQLGGYVYDEPNIKSVYNLDLANWCKEKEYVK